MATITEKYRIMKLSQADYTTLSTTGTLTKDGVTYTYSPSDTIYVTPDDTVKQSAVKQTTGSSTTDLMSQKATSDGLSSKQDTLVNQINIKSINGTSLLGSGDLVVGGGDVDTAMSDSSTNAVQNKVIKGYVDTSIDDTIGDAMIQILGEVTV